MKRIFVALFITALLLVVMVGFTILVFVTSWAAPLFAFIVTFGLLFLIVYTALSLGDYP